FPAFLRAGVTPNPTLPNLAHCNRLAIATSAKSEAFGPQKKAPELLTKRFVHPVALLIRPPWCGPVTTLLMIRLCEMFAVLIFPRTCWQTRLVSASSSDMPASPLLWQLSQTPFAAWNWLPFFIIGRMLLAKSVGFLHVAAAATCETLPGSSL